MTNVPATPKVAHQQPPAEVVMAAAAGQPALLRIARTNMLRAITRMSFAVEQSALPAPEVVHFERDRHAVALEFATIAEAEAWAAELNAERAGELSEGIDAASVRWRGYSARATWRGYEVSLAALERASEQRAAVSA